MKRWMILGSLALVVLAVVVGLGVMHYAQAAPEPTFRLGGKVDNVTLRDLKGQSHKLFDLGDGSKLTVLMFIATQCPVSNAYNERMAALERDYAAKGVKFLAVNANRQESVAEVTEHAARHGFQFPIFKDEGNPLADLFGASVTPETYVLDPSWTIRYHGRIDNSQDPGHVERSDLRNALDALLSGKAVPVTETKAFGCTIKRVRKS